MNETELKRAIESRAEDSYHVARDWVSKREGASGRIGPAMKGWKLCESVSSLELRRILPPRGKRPPDVRITVGLHRRFTDEHYGRYVVFTLAEFDERHARALEDERRRNRIRLALVRDTNDRKKQAARDLSSLARRSRIVINEIRRLKMTLPAVMPEADANWLVDLAARDALGEAAPGRKE
jgi:hypothetical protein